MATAADKDQSKATMQGKLGDTMEKYKELLQKVKPLLEKVEPFMAAVVPHIVKIQAGIKEVYLKVEPYYDDEVGHIALGVVLLFFGGHFAMTIACYQVFRISGHRTISKSWGELRTSFQDAYHKLEMEPEADKAFGKDKDGSIPLWSIFTSVKQLALAKNEEEKMSGRKKVLLLLKCIDPNKIWDAAGGLFTGLLAILAALRSRFVQCLTLGANVGKKVVAIIEPMIQPKLYEAYPNNKQWVDFVLRAGGSVVGGIVSLILIRVISAFNSSLEGASMLVERCLTIGKRKGYVEELAPEMSRIIIAVLTCVGLFTQVRSGFTLPLLLRLLLSPVLFVEYVLTLLAARPI